MVLQSQRDWVLQPSPGFAESARLPWVSVRGIFNPNGVGSPLHHRATTPLADTTRFSQGCEPRATPGFGMESLWDSALEFPKGRGSNPGGIGLQACVTSQQLRDPNIQHGTSNMEHPTWNIQHPTSNSGHPFPLTLPSPQRRGRSICRAMTNCDALTFAATVQAPSPLGRG